MNSITISPRKKAAKSPWNEPSVPLVSVLAHELRNPLTNIMLTFIYLNPKYWMIVIECLWISLRRSSVKMNDLINDLLKGQQEVEIKVEKYSIHQLLDEVIEMAKDKITIKKHCHQKDYAPHDLKIKMDMPKIKIALTNIIINAIDAMGTEKGELRLGTNLIKGRTCRIDPGQWQWNKQREFAIYFQSLILPISPAE
jgi:signal transduction histidine kinase